MAWRRWRRRDHPTTSLRLLRIRATVPDHDAAGTPVKVTVVGCSGSFPGPDSPASSYLVEADGYRMLLDIGNGAVGALQRYLDLADLDAVLVSHLHPDHCIDLLSLYVARVYDPVHDYDRLPVHVPAGGATHLARAYGRADEPGLVGAFDFIEWSAGKHDIGPFSVTVAQMDHPVETWGMRVEHGSSALTYSGDTGPCDNLVELARDTDLALLESSFEADRDTKAPQGLHLTGGQAGEAAARAGARRLVLTHLPPWNDPAVSRRAAEAAFGGPLELAAPGATYEV